MANADDHDDKPDLDGFTPTAGTTEYLAEFQRDLAELVEADEADADGDGDDEQPEIRRISDESETLRAAGLDPGQYDLDD